MILGGNREPLALLVVTYVAARLLLVINAEPFTTNDSAAYQGPVDLLGGATRPWVVPAVHALMPDRGVLLFQATLSAVAFLVLALSLAATLQSIPLRVGVMAVVLLIGVSSRVTNWDMAMLSESIAISTTCLLIAALAHVDVLVHHHRFLLVAALAVWAFSRDASTLLAVPLGLILAVYGWRQRERAMSFALVGVAVWSGFAMSNDQWVEGYNVTTHIANGVGQSDPDAIDWFIDRGMPEGPPYTMRGYSGDRRQAIRDHDEFVEWSESAGPTTYVRYALAHPDYLLLEPWRNVWLDDPGAKRPHDGEAIDTIWPRDDDGFTAVLAGAAVLLALTARRQIGRFRAFDLVALGVVGSTVVQVYLVFHGSAIEHYRHSLLMQFGLALGAWWLLALSVDRLMSASDVTGSPQRHSGPLPMRGSQTTSGRS